MALTFFGWLKGSAPVNGRSKLEFHDLNRDSGDQELLLLEFLVPTNII